MDGQQSATANRTAKEHPPIDPKFVALLIHDLRSPLNVIGLSIRIIEQTAAKKGVDAKEDIKVIRQQISQMERMLALLQEFTWLYDLNYELAPTPFDARRLVTDLVECLSALTPNPVPPPRLEVGSGFPSEVMLDPSAARTALIQVLLNAVNAAGEIPLHVRLDGSGDRLEIEVRIDKAPSFTVRSQPLHGREFERIFGVTNDRRGLDLAIVARVSELFGGTAKLVAREGESTSVILDWPVRLDPAAAHGV